MSGARNARERLGGRAVPQVRNEARVNAPIDRVWALAIDANRIPEWQTTAVEVRDETGRHLFTLRFSAEEHGS